MIIGVGCDTVDHDLCRKLHWDSNPKVLTRIFSDREIEYYNSKKELKFLAGRFAVKEAVLKSFGTGMEDGISLTEIQVLQSNVGQPQVQLSGRAKEFFDQLGVRRLHVSISHSEGISTAFVIAEGGFTTSYLDVE